MNPPRLLLITSESVPGNLIGQIDGFKSLEISGELKSVRAVSHREGFDSRPAFQRVMEAVSRRDYDVLIVLTPKKFPANQSEFEHILRAIGTRPVLYLEGDAWARKNQRKSITEQMGWWMSISEIVFSPAGEPQSSIFLENGAKKLLFIPPTYCHIQFAEAEKTPPKELNSTDFFDFTMISNNTARIPFISGLPGSSKRWELASRVHFNSKHTKNIFGYNWPKSWSKGYLDYKEQIFQIRLARLSLNWDHFDQYESYASDRLPISLLAGRVHITSKHPNMNWCPGEMVGLFEEKSPREIIERAKFLLALGNPKLSKIGIEGHRWTKNRLSHRESARYIMSILFSNIKKPPSDPWGRLPKL
jgi:hypothetical protein